MTMFSCFKSSLVVLGLLFFVTEQASATEFEFYDVADDRPSYLKYLEPFLTVVTAYQVQSAPHEGVHAATAYTFGTKTKYWDVKLLKQSVSYDKENSERRREDVFFTSMSAPVFSRLTCDLPRWVYAPDGPGYWSRWTSGYWIMSYSTTWVTLLGTWASYSENDKESGWDFNNASLAATSNRRDQGVFLSGLTALMLTDLYFTWGEARNNFAAFSGRKAVRKTTGDNLSFHVGPNSLQLKYHF